MDKDFSRLVAELASGMLKDILTQVKLQIYAGPEFGILSKAEARKQLDTPKKRQEAVEFGDIDEVIAGAQSLEV